MAETLPVRWMLRHATAADIEDIATVWHRGWLDGHLGHVPEGLLRYRGLESFRERVPARLGTTTVAASGEALLGFVAVQEDEVELPYVTAAARGSGVAPALLQQAEATIAARFDRAWLAVVTGNARARRFYAREGWNDAGPLDYAAEVMGGGTFPVDSRRYEKPL